MKATIILHWPYSLRTWQRALLGRADEVIE
jgi:hypothetical protein